MCCFCYCSKFLFDLFNFSPQVRHQHNLAPHLCNPILFQTIPPSPPRKWSPRPPHTRSKAPSGRTVVGEEAAHQIVGWRRRKFSSLQAPPIRTRASSARRCCGARAPSSRQAFDDAVAASPGTLIHSRVGIHLGLMGSTSKPPAPPTTQLSYWHCDQVGPSRASGCRPHDESVLNMDTI